MYIDTTYQTQALEFLFLFHACKLTNNRPDQSVSVEDVSRAAAINQDESEAICSSLRDARLIRYSSLLGDISVTRFGVSEVVTTKACPNTGANYFPGVRQMGLRFSRGHHLFDELELRHITYNRDADQPVDENRASTADPSYSDLSHKQITGQDSFIAHKNSGSTPDQKVKSNEQIKQEVISELEQLLQQLNDQPATTSATKSTKLSERPTVRSTARNSTGNTSPARPHIPAVKKPVARPDVSARTGTANPVQTPSLLLIPVWNSGGVAKGSVAKGSATKGFAARSSVAKGNAPNNQDNHNSDSLDVSAGIEHLQKIMLRWCQNTQSGNLQSREAVGLIRDLEKINESLFSFA